MPVGIAAKKAGISRQSLQYYIMVGLIEPTEVTPTSRRMFDDSCIERIKLVKKLNESGYCLRAIRELFLQGRTKPTADPSSAVVLLWREEAAAKAGFERK